MTAPVQYVLAALADGIAAQFKVHGVPCWVRFGARAYKPEVVTKNEVVISEVPGGDSYGDTPRAGGNPPPIALRTIGASVEITGRSTEAGATSVHHRALVTSLLHQLVSALLYAGHDNGAPIEIGRGGFVDDPNQPNEYGARYALGFTAPEVICEATTWATSVVDVGFTTETVIVIDGVETVACTHEEPPPLAP